MIFKTFVLKMAQTKAGIWPSLSHTCPIRSIADRQCVVKYVEGPTRHGLVAEHRHPVRHDAAAALDGERERDTSNLHFQHPGDSEPRNMQLSS